MTDGNFANGAAYAAFAIAVEAGSLQGEDIRAGFASTPAEEIDPIQEKQNIQYAYDNAEKLGIDIPEGHEWEYSDKYAVGKMNSRGGVIKSSIREIQSLDEMAAGEQYFGALTYVNDNATVYYRGSGIAAYLESTTMTPEGLAIGI
ncbi:hypothetical protein MO867_15110 [Microbulbifer sp. OS29]|uniref:Uncharacterized protein n=1 Tax=Microbulbifer okhotskensis TaxID=2926617 RepID=A0A9X2EQ16_9GAMM|nr:hypothetical protein [Microbulbifer okhotskensis]MCO1335665.1 hypothetical protein [Microbulbifer okhotskensis]